MTSRAKNWTAVVLAGQRPGPDILASHFGLEFKAMVLVGGIPMVTRVVATLATTPGIGRIIVLTQEPQSIRAAVDAGGAATILESGSGISTSILSIAGSDAAPWPLLVTTADHPLLTRAMVEEFLDKAAQADVSVGMVDKATMLAAYPDTRRTWLKFSDGHWSGANLFALRNARAEAVLRLWSAAEQDRKKAWKLFMHFGPWLALRALTRTIGLRAALAKAGRRLGLSAQLVALSQAEAAIDVDKPADHAMAEHILNARAAASDQA